MDAVRVWLDDPRGPAAFLVAIAVITVAALLMQRTRSRQRLRAVGTSAQRPAGRRSRQRPRGVGTGAQRPWPVAGPGAPVVPAPAAAPDVESAPSATTVLPV